MTDHDCLSQPVYDDWTDLVYCGVCGRFLFDAGPQDDKKDLESA